MVVRTRACQPCRRRRIKCDATLPHCQQCIRFNRECTGPVDGALIIDMTAKVTHKPRSKPRKPNRAALSRARLCQDPGPGAYTPEPSRMISQAFIANYIAFQTSSPQEIMQRSWLWDLIEQPLEDQHPALALALRATSTAYCGLAASNRDVLTEACIAYGNALQLHGRSIARYPRTPEKLLLICTSVVLSLFEAMWSTNMSAYGAHILAAAKMLKIARPVLEGNKQLRSLAVHVQFQLIFVCITGQPSDELSLLEFDIPPDTEQHRGIDREVDALLKSMFQLAQLYCRKLSGRLSTRSELEQVQSTKAFVETLWVDFRNNACQREAPLFWVEDGQTHFLNAFTALIASYFAGARVLIAVLESDGPNDVSTQDMEAACVAILDAIKFVDTRRIGCAYLRMTLPLLLAALHSPDNAQRITAMTLLNKWHDGTPLTGLCKIALQKAEESHRWHTKRELPESHSEWRQMKPELLQFRGFPTQLT